LTVFPSGKRDRLLTVYHKEEKVKQKTQGEKKKREVLMFQFFKICKAGKGGITTGDLYIHRGGREEKTEGTTGGERGSCACSLI